MLCEYGFSLFRVESNISEYFLEKNSKISFILSLRLISFWLWLDSVINKPFISSGFVLIILKIFFIFWNKKSILYIYKLFLKMYFINI